MRAYSGYMHFNPRSHEGSDVRCTIHPTRNKISIRAPTRGATQSFGKPNLKRLFQSALPRGERHRSGTSAACHGNFNPRSHEGSDSATTYANGWTVIFQSALPRGERLLTSAKRYRIFAFQSALPRGERP